MNRLQSNKEAIKNLLKGVLNNSWSQAILKIFLTRNVTLKIFLFLFVIFSSGLASFLVIQSIMTYFRYEVSTTSRTIYENPTLFPKVTFCNVNRLATEYAFNLTQKGIFIGDNLLDYEKKLLGHDLKDILMLCIFNGGICNANDFTWSYDQLYGNCFTFNSGINKPLKESNMAGTYYGLQIVFYINVYEKLMNF